MLRQLHPRASPVTFTPVISARYEIHNAIHNAIRNAIHICVDPRAKHL